MFAYAQRRCPTYSNYEAVDQELVWEKLTSGERFRQYTAFSSEKYLDNAQDDCGPNEGEKKELILLRGDGEGFVNCDVKKRGGG